MIETAGGSADTVDLGVQAVRRVALVVVLGASGRGLIDIGQLMFKEVTVVGSFAYGSESRREELGAAAGLLTHWPGELDRLQTHRFPLASVEAAFRCAANNSSGAMKVSVMP